MRVDTNDAPFNVVISRDTNCLLAFMKKTLLLVLLILLTACNKSEKVFDKLPPNTVILAFGDSLTYGTNVNEEQSYPSVLEQLSFHPVINSVVAGEVSAEGLKRLPTVLDEEKP